MTHKKRRKLLLLTVVLLLLCALAVTGFATGVLPNLLADSQQERAARAAGAQFAAENGLTDGGVGTQSDTDAIKEETALLALCEQYKITLTEEEERDCDNYYETVMPVAEADENPEALNGFLQIVKDSGLTLEEYEAVSEANMKYALLRKKLTESVYNGDPAAYEKAAEQWAKENGL